MDTRPKELEKRRALEITDIIALVLVAIGGINWGLIGFFDWNLVNAIFGGAPWLERLIYVLVGISAVYMAIVTPMLWRAPKTVGKTATGSSY